MDTLPVLVPGRTVRPRRLVPRLPWLVAAALIAACSGGANDDTATTAETTATDQPSATAPIDDEPIDEAEPPTEHTDEPDAPPPINTGLPTTHNQVRDNVADNLTLNSDHTSLLLGLVGHGAWSLDLTPLTTDE